MKLKTSFVQSYLSSAFTKLGFSVGCHPIPYLILPIIATAVLSIGFYWLKVLKDNEFLFTPMNGRSIKERAAVESLFPPSKNSFDWASVTRLRETTMIFLLPKDNSSVLRENILEDAIKLENIVYNISVKWENKTFSLKDLCAKGSLGYCSRNDVLDLRGQIRDIRRRKMHIRFPLNYDRISQQVTAYPVGLGGVKLDDNGVISYASALRLFYILDHSTPDIRELSCKWEETFLDVISKIRLQNVKIFAMSGPSIQNEVNRITELCIPCLIITVPLMVIFAIVSTMTTSCVRSKPLVAIAGCICPMLGVISAFGLLLLLGVQYVDINIVAPFLLIGVGLDDAFIMLAGWRRTNPRLRVEERLSQTYSESAVSITITSLTNCLSLCVGLASPYRIIRIHCAYAALSLLFAYMYQITFFGSALTLSGIRERKGLHSLFFIPVEEKTRTDSIICKFIYTGCTDQKLDGIREKSNTEASYVEILLSMIFTKGGKLVVIGSFLIYIMSSGYCLTFIREEFDFRNAMPYDSYLADYLNVYYEYFTQYPHQIHVVVNKTLDYSSKYVQDDIEDVFHELSGVPHIGEPVICFSWLKFYLQTVRNKKLWLLYHGYNISDKSDFIHALRNVFLKLPSARQFNNHIRFNENNTEIISSRFIIISRSVHSSVEENRLLLSLWEKIDSLRYPLYVHNLLFPTYDISTEIFQSSITTIFAATGLVTAIFFVVIPNITCTITILFTILSVQTGVIGFSSLWGVPLDPVAMICHVISVGLSIDYAAHICYSYLCSTVDSPDERSKVALRSAGFPIIQGGLSTLLGVGAFAFANMNVFLVFFKTITLVMLLSLFHGLLVIPVALNVLDTVWERLFFRVRKLRQLKQ